MQRLMSRLEPMERTIMPFIHVKSLPLKSSLKMNDVVEGLTRDFAQGTGIGLEHVTATWEFLPSAHYAVAGKSALHQPKDSHPILVDLLVPDFNSSDDVEKMLPLIASSISRQTSVPFNNIFINCRQAASGFVLDTGKIIRW